MISVLYKIIVFTDLAQPIISMVGTHYVVEVSIVIDS